MKTVYLLLASGAVLAAQTFSGSAALDQVIEKAVADGQIPGAVLLVGQPGRILDKKAYGERALVPAREKMTTDTIFDAASLTKVVATTTSVMKLVEQGKIRIADKVTDYLPKFRGGTSDITIRHLMTHFSGLRPDLDLRPAWSGYETGIQKALIDKPVRGPGEQFTYSDINFILLGEIVHLVSGKPLDEYARDEIFRPLGMNESMYRPWAAWRPRIAPTEVDNGAPLRGVVHDETTRYMGGVAGHAGLFTTAADLAIFAEMLLGRGERNGVRILSPLSVKKMTEPNTPPHQPILRGLGWDIDSAYSGNRGELFPVGSFGHTGFTGTSIWIDPYTNTYVILLANSVHPHRRPAITSLRGRVATIVAAALQVDAPGLTLTGLAETAARRTVSRNVQVLTGIDVLAEESFARLKNRRVGLITNAAGLTRDGRRDIDAMLEGGVKLTALFSAEHGLTAKQDQENVADAKDEKSGLPVHSLYRSGERTPNASVLAGVDALVFDLQDIGARYWTYACTMKNALEAAAKAGKPVYILDRPNPINGLKVEGPMIDDEYQSFVGCFALPVRHGMTMGELATMFNTEGKIGAKLEVVPMKGWSRADFWDSTGLTWIDPSPNMRSLNAALLFPSIAWIEYSRNWSVGRGTDAPFEQAGADWLKARDVANYLNKRFLPGVRCYPTTFQPTASFFAKQTIPGLRFVITDREMFSSLRLGLELGAALEKFHPGKIPWDLNMRLIGSRTTVDRIRKGEDPRAIELDLIESLQPFLELRKKYLIYK